MCHVFSKYKIQKQNSYFLDKVFQNSSLYIVNKVMLLNFNIKENATHSNMTYLEEEYDHWSWEYSRLH